MGGQSGQYPNQVLAEYLVMRRRQCQRATLLLAHPALGSYLRPWKVLLLFDTCFPSYFKLNIVSKKSQIISLWPQTYTTFSQRSVPALKNWENK